MIANSGEISMRSLRTGQLTPQEHKRFGPTVEGLAKLPIFMEDSYAFSITRLISRCRQLKTKHELALVVVDYLQLVEGSNKRRNDNRQLEVADVSRSLTLMAKELGVAVLALSQLNDNGLLRESRAIGQDADIVLRISTPDSDDAFRRTIVIEKNRDGQRWKRIPVEFHGQYMCFSDAPLDPESVRNSFKE
jgi:replicative DNA helicase